jgi:hypothetical protein
VVLQQVSHGALFVTRFEFESVTSIDANPVQHRIPKLPQVDYGGYLVSPQLLSGFDTMEAVGEPEILGPILEHDDWREHGAVPHILAVCCYALFVGLPPDLGATI